MAALTTGLLLLLLGCSFREVESSSNCLSIRKRPVYISGKPLVTVKSGNIRGIKRKTANGREFFSFEGIPYAEPPVGDLRFQDPLPESPWLGDWDASRPAGMCLQLEPSLRPSCKIQGWEDCLYLNVYTPKLPTEQHEEKLSVLIFIHPGAFMFGSGSEFGPLYFLDKDLVLVTFNYRLGILGFLSTEDEVCPGNLGMKDQVMALKWVKKNIEAFGGDPNKVTISGLSAGAASASYHMLSPMSEGLFQQIITWSGTALCPWAHMRSPKENAFKLGELMGCAANSSQQLIDCLKKRPAYSMVSKTPVFQDWLMNPFSPFGPTVECAGANPFLSEDPSLLMAKGAMKDVPWLIGTTTEEGLYPVSVFVANETAKQELSKRFIDLAPLILHYDYGVPQDMWNEIGSSISAEYFSREPVTDPKGAQLVKMAGDYLYEAPTALAIVLAAQHFKNPIYYYRFNYRGQNSLSDEFTFNKKNYGVSNGDDVAYMLDVCYCNTAETKQDREMSKFLLDLVYNFICSGNPTCGCSPVPWDPINPNAQTIDYFFIKSTSEYAMESSDNIGNYKYWFDLIPMPVHCSDEINIPGINK